jgi:holo-[acyl-carrier protein] synthase
MIVGLGTDMVEVQRLKASIDRFGERFVRRIFTAGEQAYCAGKRHPEESLAARFAAKEAAAKALGTGISRGVGWQNFEVSREHGRAPRLQLNGRALEIADALGVRRISLSLTHTDSVAAATVILESD